MSTFDILFASVAAVGALVLLVMSPWHRAVAKESLLHPRSNGWVDFDGDRVEVHRGLGLPDFVLAQTVESLGEAQTALETASRELQSQATKSPPSGRASPWLPYAAIAASVAAVAAAATAFLGSDAKPSSKGRA